MKLEILNLETALAERLKGALKPYRNDILASFAKVRELREEIARHDNLHAEEEFTRLHLAAMNGDKAAAAQICDVGAKEFYARYARKAGYIEGQLARHNQEAGPLFVKACTAVRKATQELCELANRQARAFAEASAEPAIESGWAATRGRDILHWTGMVIEGNPLADSSPILEFC